MTEKDLKALYELIQQSEKVLGQEKTYDAFLALARFGSLIGFPDSNNPDEQVGAPGSRATEQLLDINGVADFLKVFPRTVHKLMTTRILPYYKIGKTVRFRLEDTLKALKPYMIAGRLTRRRP